MKNDLQKEFEKSTQDCKNEISEQIKIADEAIKKITYISEKYGIPIETTEMVDYIPESFFVKFRDNFTIEEGDDCDWSDANEYFESICGVRIPYEENYGWMNSSSYC